MDMKVELLLSFSFSRKVLTASDEKVSRSTCLAMSSQPELEEEESSEEETVKEVIVSMLLSFPAESVTLIVQSEYVPSLKELK